MHLSHPGLFLVRQAVAASRRVEELRHVHHWGARTVYRCGCIEETCASCRAVRRLVDCDRPATCAAFPRGE